MQNFTLTNKKAKIIFISTLSAIIMAAIVLMVIVPQDVARFVPGNTHGNLMNGGYVLHHRGDTFVATNNSVYRLQANNELAHVFTDENALSLFGLQGIGNRIYFMRVLPPDEQQNESLLGHFNLLTGQLTVVDLPEITLFASPQVVGSWIYFRGDMFGGIYKARENGTGLTQLVTRDENYNATQRDFNVQNSRVYFMQVNASEEANLYIMNIDGTNINRIIENVGRFFVSGDFIYFMRHDRSSAVYVYNMRTSTTTEVFNVGTESAFVSEFNLFRNYLIISTLQYYDAASEILAIDLSDGHVQSSPIILGGMRDISDMDSDGNWSPKEIFMINSTPTALFVGVIYNDTETTRIYKFTDVEGEPVIVK